MNQQWWMKQRSRNCNFVILPFGFQYEDGLSEELIVLFLKLFSQIDFFPCPFLRLLSAAKNCLNRHRVIWICITCAC